MRRVRIEGSSEGDIAGLIDRIINGEYIVTGIGDNKIEVRVASGQVKTYHIPEHSFKHTADMVENAKRLCNSLMSVERDIDSLIANSRYVKVVKTTRTW